MESKMKWLKWPLEHYSISLLIVAILFVAGIYGMYVMPKDEFPHVVIRQGVVVAVYPGATSEEIEEQVTKPLERYLFTFSEVNRTKTTSTSQNGMAIIMVRLNDDVDNKDEVWSKIKHGVNGYKAQLPSGVLAVVVNDDFGNTSALLVAIESAQRSYRELKSYADNLSDRLRRIPSVANVNLYGEQRERISIYLDRKRLEAYGIGQQFLMSQLSAQGFSTTGGSINTADNQVPIHVSTVNNSVQEIENQIIYSDPSSGKTVRVGDIADVVREYPPDSPCIEQDGHPCVLLSMEMTPGNNVVQYGEDVDKVLDDFRLNSLPDDVTITRIADKPKVVAMSVSSFLRDLLLSMAVIILVMMVLFPLRSAVVAAATIPLSTFVSVAVMYMAGIELNIVTLAALIVVLGMIVDNSIVVIDGYLEYLNKGFMPKVAALKSAEQYFMPMMLATICICAIFYPFLLTMKGTFHDALKDFPLTITINLLVSLLLAVTVIPFLEVKIIKPGKVSTDGNIITKTVQRIYDRTLAFTFKKPWFTIICGIGIIMLSSLIMPTLKIRLFPYADRDQFAVEIFLPEGKGIAQARTVADSVRKIIAADPRATSITSFIGCSSPRFMDAYAPQMAGKNFAQMIVNTTSQDDALEMLYKYQSMLSESFPEAYVKFKRLDYLEVDELEYRFYGDNIDSLLAAAEMLEDRMRLMPEIEWVHNDFNGSYPLVDIRPDAVAASQTGFSRSSIALALAAYTGEIQAGSIWENGYELGITICDKAGLKFSDINNIGIASPQTLMPSPADNYTVAIRQIADVEPLWSQSRINHRCGERCITVKAQFAPRVFTAPVEKRIDEISKSELTLPQGVRYEFGGELEYGDEALPQIFWGIVLAMVMVFFFLLFNFKRYGITTICMAALSLMTPGALIGLGLMDRALGLTSIFGLITLMGMIMRNEILIFEHADNIAATGASIRSAAFDAGKRRMVPIFLTTATTAVGVVPMIIAQSSFWMPVGVTIFAGGIGALIMAVTMLPVVYWKVNNENKNQNQ